VVIKYSLVKGEAKIKLLEREWIFECVRDKGMK
jgi:hypothetical protein